MSWKHDRIPSPPHLNGIFDGITRNRVSVTMKFGQLVRACLEFGRSAESFRYFHLRMTTMANDHVKKKSLEDLL